MAELKKIRVMISSRSMSQVFAGGLPLCEVRLRLQTFIEGLRWCTETTSAAPTRSIGRSQPLFDVWIHEKDVGRPASQSTLDVSLREIARADVVVVLYTGEAGSSNGDAEIGICHAELQEALARRPEIVTGIRLPPTTAPQTPKDLAFQDFVERQKSFLVDADNEETLRDCIVDLLHQRVAELTRRGASFHAGKRDRGQALDWKSLDLAERGKVMRATLRHALDATPIKTDFDADRLCRAKLPLVGDVALRVDAVAATLSVAAARESVGQPHLTEHRHSAVLEAEALPGIVNLVACHRGITENQAARFLGTADAVTVSSDFGVYAADHVQQIQYVFLADCADESATALALRRFREWLQVSGANVGLDRRAHARRRILAAIARELSNTDTGKPQPKVPNRKLRTAKKTNS